MGKKDDKGSMMIDENEDTPQNQKVEDTPSQSKFSSVCATLSGQLPNIVNTIPAKVTQSRSATNVQPTFNKHWLYFDKYLPP